RPHSRSRRSKPGGRGWGRRGSRRLARTIGRCFTSSHQSLSKATPMRSLIWRGGVVAILSSLAAGCAGGVPPDEALARVRREGGEFASLGPDSGPDAWRKAAEHFYPPARRDYFEEM